MKLRAINFESVIKIDNEKYEFKLTLIEFDIEEYLNRKFDKVLLFKTGKGLGNLFLKAVSYFNYAILNNMMFCIDFDKYSDFKYDTYFTKNYNLEFKNFIKNNENCQIISTNDLPDNILINGIGFFYKYWVNTTFNSKSILERNKLVSSVFKNIFNFMFPIKENSKYSFLKNNIPSIGLQIRFGSYLN